MDGTPSEMMKKVDPFFKKLQKISSIPCELVDERLTSFEAKQLMHVDSKDDRIDDLAANMNGKRLTMTMSMTSYPRSVKISKSVSLLAKIPA